MNMHNFQNELADCVWVCGWFYLCQFLLFIQKPEGGFILCAAWWHLFFLSHRISTFENRFFFKYLFLLLSHFLCVSQNWPKRFSHTISNSLSPTTFEHARIHTIKLTNKHFILSLYWKRRYYAKKTFFYRLCCVLFAKRMGPKVVLYVFFCFNDFAGVFLSTSSSSSFYLYFIRTMW